MRQFEGSDDYDNEEAKDVPLLQGSIQSRRHSHRTTTTPRTNTMAAMIPAPAPALSSDGESSSSGSKHFVTYHKKECNKQ